MLCRYMTLGRHFPTWIIAHSPPRVLCGPLLFLYREKVYAMFLFRMSQAWTSRFYWTGAVTVHRRSVLALALVFSIVDSRWLKSPSMTLARTDDLPLFCLVMVRRNGPTFSL